MPHPHVRVKCPGNDFFVTASLKSQQTVECFVDHRPESDVLPKRFYFSV